MRTKIESFLNRLDLITAAVMAAAFPFSFALFNVGIVILIISFFMKRILKKDFSLFDFFMDGCMVLFYVVAISSFFQSSDRMMTLQGVHKLGRYLLLFIATRELIKTPKDVQWIIWGLLSGAAIACIDGVLQYLLGADPLRGQTVFLGFEDLIRITSCFPNPNALSIYLSTLMPLAFCVARYGKLGKAKTVLLVALNGLSLICLFYTYARPAVIALFLNAVLFWVLKKDKKIPLFFLVIGLLGVLFLQGEVKSWILQLHSFGDFIVDKGRFYHQHAALNMIAHKPWLGVGMNTFDINYAQYRLAGDPFTRWSAHQGYLQIGAETGLLGLGSFVMFLLAMVVYAWKRFPKNMDSWIQACFLGVAGGFLSFLVSGFFESLFWQPRQANFFWFWSGILCAMAHFVADQATAQNVANKGH